MKNTDKITLTVGQIKKLINESDWSRPMDKIIKSYSSLCRTLGGFVEIKPVSTNFDILMFEHGSMLVAYNTIVVGIKLQYPDIFINHRLYYVDNPYLDIEVDDISFNFSEFRNAVEKWSGNEWSKLLGFIEIGQLAGLF